MPNILYTIFIFPIESLVEFCYIIAFRLTGSPGLSILCISIAISSLVLPVYLMAERQQQAERDKQKLMKGEIDIIKTVFSGDKQYMMLSALYRQHNYHPVYSLRNITGLLIQIPFFIAAFHFLNNLESLKGQSFLFINDLSAEDKLLGGINILPFIMTALNIASGTIYTGNLSPRDKLQAYGMSAVFLLLLYNSASALLLYWTVNNIYSLLKNILLKSKYCKHIIFGFTSFIFLFISVYILIFFKAILIMRILIFMINSIILAIIVLKYFNVLKDESIKTANTVLEYPLKAFILSVLCIFLLTGLVIPSALISSSVEEFSRIKPFNSPIPFIMITLLQSFGIMFYLTVLFLLSKSDFKTHFTFFISLALLCFLANTLFFNPDYGFMTPDLLFSDFHEISAKEKIINILTLVLIAVPAIFLVLNKRKIIFYSLQVIILFTLLATGIYQLIYINKNTSEAVLREVVPDFSKKYTFSKHGSNILLVILDTAKPGYLPYIFQEKPELQESFQGFTFFPNTISAGSFTMHGMPGIYGGYLYSPFELNKRRDVYWRTKSVEAMQVLPRLLAGAGYKVTLTDQPWMGGDFYNNFENIELHKNVGRFRELFMDQFDNLSQKNYFDILNTRLIRFSLFKILPLSFNSFVYNEGNYITAMEIFSYSTRVIDNFSALHYLPDITAFADGADNYSSLIFNELTHEYAYFSQPDYFPGASIGYKGSGPFSGEYHYHTFIAAFSMLARWFEYLKENGVYDNTRIIITSDHGTSSPSPFRDNIRLPNGRWLDYYSALLLFKDFNAEGDLRIDNSFMSNMDTPHLLTEGIIDKLIDPNTGREMTVDKAGGVYIPNVHFLEAIRAHRTTGYVYTRDWLHVKDNIFDLRNWTALTIE